MSWASHNPELYEQIEREGVQASLEKALHSCGFDEVDIDTVRAIIEVLSTEFPKVWDALTSAALKQISDAEADHWANIADARG